MEKINLKEFDILGVITLTDVEGIEKYVTPITKDSEKREYLSRSREYYNVKTMEMLSVEREELKKKLTQEFSKKNFVILENMLNCSARVYFKKFEQYLTDSKNEGYLQEFHKAENCLLEDTRNLIISLSGKGKFQKSLDNVLPIGNENSERRFIEMDNKAMLYIFSKSLGTLDYLPEYEVMTPGYGSIYIGPFLKIMHGFEFTNIYKSKYISETKNLSGGSIKDYVSTARAFDQRKAVLLLDDNIGTGTTMIEMKEKLRDEGIDRIISGAVQYNWRNYFRISIGEKTGINRFDLNEYDILTPINYAGHNLYEHAVDCLTSSGNDYIDYLKNKGYRREEYSDLIGAMLRAFDSTEKIGLCLCEKVKRKDIANISEYSLLEEYKNTPTTISNPNSQKLVNTLENMITSICFENKKSQQERSYE